LDVTPRSRDHDKVRLALGPSWDGRFASYTSLRIAWSNGVVTVINLPQGWSTRDREFHVTPWVDSWHQDVRIHTERERKNRPRTQITRGAQQPVTITMTTIATTTQPAASESVTTTIAMTTAPPRCPGARSIPACGRTPSGPTWIGSATPSRTSS